MKLEFSAAAVDDLSHRDILFPTDNVNAGVNTEVRFLHLDSFSGHGFTLGFFLFTLPLHKFICRDCSI